MWQQFTKESRGFRFVIMKRYQTFTNCVSSYNYNIFSCYTWLYVIRGRSLELKTKPMLYVIIYGYVSLVFFIVKRVEYVTWIN